MRPSERLVRCGILVLGLGWALATGDLLLDWNRSPKALDGFDPAMVYLWTAALLLTGGFVILRWLLAVIPPYGSPQQRDLALTGLFPVAAVVLLFARLVDLVRVPRGSRDLILLGLLLVFAASMAAVVLWGCRRFRVGERVDSIRLVLGFAWGLHVAFLVAIAPGHGWVPVVSAALGLGLLGGLLLIPRGVVWRGVSLGLLLVAAPLCGLVATAPDLPATGEPAVTPVILVTVDTLRADQIRLYADDGVSTPAIEHLAQSGILFTEAHSPAPWTIPGLGSILTGLSPVVHGAIRPEAVLPSELPTLGGFLGRQGYRTAAFVNNPHLARQTPLRRDFDIYRTFPRVPSLSIGAKVLRQLWPEAYDPDVGPDELTDLAIRFVKEHRDEPFFLWVHYFDPHSPYTPPRRFWPAGEPPPGYEQGLLSANEIRDGYEVLNAEERSWVQGLYRGEIQWMDENLARLWDALERVGLWEGASIVLTGDHGEEFWEHDGFFHGHTLHRELLHVPLIVKLPDGEAGGEIHRRVTTASVTPTLLDLVDAPVRSERFTAPSVAGAWREDSTTYALDEIGPMLATGVIYHENQTALLSDDVKYIRWEISGSEELYDVEADPHEQQPLVEVPVRLESARDQLDELEARYDSLRRRYGLPDELSTPHDLDPATREQLRSLGYID